MPAFEGFDKAVQEIEGIDKYVYVAKENNRYKVKVGAIGGFYKEEVIFEGEKVGGIAFIPKIVEQLLADKDGKAIVVPADISEIDSQDNVDLFFESLTGKDGKFYKNILLTIDTNGNNVSIVNTVITNSIANNFHRDDNSAFPEYVKNGITGQNIDAGLYELMIFGNFDFQEEFDDFFQFGIKLTETKKIFGLTYHLVFTKTIEIDDLLKVEKSIVFLQDIN
jgi:hypothetical protein